MDGYALEPRLGLVLALFCAACAACAAMQLVQLIALLLMLLLRLLVLLLRLAPTGTASQRTAKVRSDCAPDDLLIFAGAFKEKVHADYVR